MTETTYAIQFRVKGCKKGWQRDFHDPITDLEEAREKVADRRAQFTRLEYRLVRIEITEVE